MSLHIGSVIVRALGRIAPIVVLLKRRNRNLADQLDRASSSILLNTSEGAYSQKGHQNVTSGWDRDQDQRDHRGPGDHALICGQINPLVGEVLGARQRPEHLSAHVARSARRRGTVRVVWV